MLQDTRCGVAFFGFDRAPAAGAPGEIACIRRRAFSKPITAKQPIVPFRARSRQLAESAHSRSTPPAGPLLRFFHGLFYHSGDMIALLAQTVLEMGGVWLGRRRLLRQLREVGVNTFPLVAMISIFTGMVIALRTGYALRGYNLQESIGTIVGLSMVCEMGPVITAILIVGRVGSAMAAELGTMAVNEEIDALRAMGINPVRFLVVPRFVALLVMEPILTVYGTLIGIWGGGLISLTYLRVPSMIYYDRLYRSVELADVRHGMEKTLVFAVIIAIVCCYMGMNTENGAEGVGKSTTRAVVISLTLVLVANYFMTRFFGMG